MKSVFIKYVHAVPMVFVLWALTLAAPEVRAEELLMSGAHNCSNGKDGNSKMFKVLVLLKRRDGMSVEAFRDYYETQHAPLALSFISKHICRYFRRFVNRQLDAATGEVVGPSYDSVSEFWFASREAYQETMRELAKPEVKAAMDKDEAQLFDRSKMIVLEVEEYESVITPTP